MSSEMTRLMRRSAGYADTIDDLRAELQQAQAAFEAAQAAHDALAVDHWNKAIDRLLDQARALNGDGEPERYSRFDAGVRAPAPKPPDMNARMVWSVAAIASLSRRLRAAPRTVSDPQPGSPRAPGTPLRAGFASRLVVSLPSGTPSVSSPNHVISIIGVVIPAGTMTTWSGGGSQPGHSRETRDVREDECAVDRPMSLSGPIAQPVSHQHRQYGPRSAPADSA